MGGSGSGIWYRWSKRGTTEASHSIDIRWLKREGALVPGGVRRITWSCNGKKTGSIGYQVFPDFIVLKFRQRQQGSKWENVEQCVYFDWTPLTFGLRQWFECPHCQRRVAVIYGVGKYFLCRHCSGLKYESQNEDVASRALRKQQKLNEKLKAPDGWDAFDGIPPKPKWMHHKTYKRLCRKSRILSRRLNVAVSQRFGVYL